MESMTLGCSEPDGPGMGLAGFFLIHIKGACDLKSLPRLAVVGDENVVVERRRRGWTRVHSLATIACSTKVVGGSTGILTPAQLPMEARCDGLLGDGTGVAIPHELRRRIESHSIVIDRWAVFFCHCFKHRDSAEEESDRFGEGEMEEGKKEDSPWDSPATEGEVPSSPAGSAAGDVIAQKCPESRPNGSPLISPRNHITAFAVSTYVVLLTGSCTCSLRIQQANPVPKNTEAQKLAESWRTIKQLKGLDPEEYDDVNQVAVLLMTCKA
jgi:hypothetical protein